MWRSKTLVSVLALAGSALSTPILPRNGHYTNTVYSFGLIAIHSGSEVQSSAINSNGGGFWIGKPTTSYCPKEEVGFAVCPPGTSTGFIQGAVSDTLSLDVAVAGGQEVYITANGQLSHTKPHNISKPAGAYTRGFHYTPSEGNNVGSLTWNNTGFLACPQGTGNSTEGYRIWAAVPGRSTVNCIGIALAAVESNVPANDATAWEYI